MVLLSALMTNIVVPGAEENLLLYRLSYSPGELAFAIVHREKSK